jgi:hypothetical protein
LKKTDPVEELAVQVKLEMVGHHAPPDPSHGVLGIAGL